MVEKLENRFLLPLGLLLFCSAGVELISALTDAQDAIEQVGVWIGVSNPQQNVSTSWGKTEDPCGLPWEGVTCTDSRVTGLQLSSMNIKGRLEEDIGQLSQLTTLDLSNNRNLTGPLSPRIGDLKMLNHLILTGCGFSGSIPTEIGSLVELSFLALNSNYFSGSIPPSLGMLSKLYLLALADNQLTGSIPISTETSPGLDRLLNAKHFHLNNNRLSGSIPAKLSSSQMVLIHMLLDGNNLTGEIPPTLGLVKTLEVLRLDRNSLSGTVPSNLNNLTGLSELNLANNKLTGPVPDLTQMSNLNYVNLSNNLFDPSKAPTWFSALQSLTSLVMENTNLQGSIPETLFSLPQLQQVMLRDNQFNGTLDLGHNVGKQLQLVDFENNDIASVILRSSYNNTLMLAGNPVCGVLSNTAYCQPASATEKPHSTNFDAIGS